MIAESMFGLLAPEVILAIGAAGVLMLGLWRSDRGRSASAAASMATLLLALITAWYAGLRDNPVAAPGIRITNLTWYVRMITLSIGVLVVLVHWRLPARSEHGEIFSMILFSLIGILVTSLADDLVVLFLAIELVSVPTYVLVSAGRSDVRAQEAGVKYFFLGALSAALLVYGFSFLYGSAGTTTLTHIRAAVGTDADAGVTGAVLGGYATIGLLLAFAGIAFKITAVPFHVYAADVYQGAASPVTGLLGFAPKLAGFVALIKLLMLVQPAGAAGPGWALPGTVLAFLWLVAAATMTVGNVLALVQTNAKRMLAYSGIAHSGYMLIAVLAGPSADRGPMGDGLSALLFYIAAYGIMNLGAFAVLALLRSRERPVEELDDLAGLARSQPVIAIALAVCVFSLLGMPPTAGFFGKLYVFSSALAAGPEHPYQLALIVLAVVGVINAAVAAAYYLRIVAVCYLGEESAPVTVTPRAGALQVGVLACCVAILLIGLWPQGLMQMAGQPVYDFEAGELPAARATLPADSPAGKASAALEPEARLPNAEARTPNPEPSLDPPPPRRIRCIHLAGTGPGRGPRPAPDTVRPLEQRQTSDVH